MNYMNFCRQLFLIMYANHKKKFLLLNPTLYFFNLLLFLFEFKGFILELTFVFIFFQLMTSHSRPTTALKCPKLSSICQKP